MQFWIVRVRVREGLEWQTESNSLLCCATVGTANQMGRANSQLGFWLWNNGDALELGHLAYNNKNLSYRITIYSNIQVVAEEGA